MNNSITIDLKTVRILERILEHGERVELIPIKDGFKVMRIKRENVNLSA